MLLCDLSFTNMFFSAVGWKARECLELHRAERNPVEFKCIQRQYICVLGQRMTSTSSSAVQSLCDIIVIHMNQRALSQSQSGSDDYLICSSSSSRGGGRRRGSNRTHCAQWRCIFFINSRHANTWMRQHIRGGRSLICSQGLRWPLLLKQWTFVHCRVTVFHYK